MNWDNWTKEKIQSYGIICAIAGFLLGATVATIVYVLTK